MTANTIAGQTVTVFSGREGGNDEESRKGSKSWERNKTVYQFAYVPCIVCTMHIAFRDSGFLRQQCENKLQGNDAEIHYDNCAISNATVCGHHCRTVTWGCFSRPPLVQKVLSMVSCCKLIPATPCLYQNRRELSTLLPRNDFEKL